MSLAPWKRVTVPKPTKIIYEKQLKMLRINSINIFFSIF